MMTYLSKLWFDVSITSETSIGRAESREIGAQKWKSAELFLNFQKKKTLLPTYEMIF